MFAIAYGTEGGVNYGHMLDMEVEERRWFLERLMEQQKLEAEEIKKAGKKK